MTLLNDIQTAAVDRNHALSDLLRKCQILASRLRHEPFKAWVFHELNGYPEGVDLPPYRVGIPGELKAQLSGPFGSSATDVPVPISLFPSAARDGISHINFYQGVAALENLVAQANANGRGLIHSPLPVEAFANLEVFAGYSTVRMWLQVSVAAVAGLLDQVRNRALAFVLDIEAENPAAGELNAGQAGGEPPIPLGRTEAIFNTVINGGIVTIGPGASQSIAVTVGDLGGLLRYLDRLGVGPDDRDGLINAIGAEPASSDQGDGARTRAAEWLGTLAMKMASSTGRVGELATGGLVAAALARYFGLA